MKKLLAGFTVSLMACLIISGAAVASGGAQTGDRDGSPDQDRDQTRDGSCLDSIEQNKTLLFFVSNGNGTGDQDRDRDRDPDQDRDRDRDCLNG